MKKNSFKKLFKWKCISLLLPLVCFIKTNIAQTQEWDRVIEFPGALTGGALGADIIEVNGKAFIWSTDLIRIYDISTNTLIDTIMIIGGYGKFNPVYFHTDVYVADYNLMAYNPDNHILYIVTPDLKILGVDVDEQGYPRQIMHQTPESIQHFNTLQGLNVIKYDQVHDRLYWLVDGRSTQLNGIGEFHTKDCYLGIFDVGLNGQLTDYYEVFTEGVGTNYRNSIFDVEFNELNSRFYVAKKRKIEIWEIVDPPQKVQLTQTILTSAGKYSKLLYIRGENIHKILAFPYRLPEGNTEELGMDNNVKLHIIDGNDNSVDSVISPSKMILDADYNFSNNDLLVCYSPNDIYVQTLVVGLNTDFAVYSYSGNFSSSPYTSFLTSTLPIEVTEDDPNRPLNLISSPNNEYWLSKIHEVGKLSKNQGQYSYTQVYQGINNFFFRGISQGGSNDKGYILGAATGTLDIFNQDNHESKRIGFPTYNITANPIDRELYLYNTLVTKKAGLYIYDQATGSSTNINDDPYANNDLQAPIGDCIYNSFKNHILISENEYKVENCAKVKILDGSTHEMITELTLQNVQYAKEMFIAPDGRLYILANMHTGYTPRLFIYEASSGGNNYSAIASWPITMPSYDPGFRYYVAHFCYNPDNKAVYVTVKPNDLPMSPYGATSNSMFGYDAIGNYENLDGIFFKVVEDQVVIISNSLELPGEILFPGDGNSLRESLYDKIIFINGRTLTFFNYETEQLTSTDLTLNNITYSAYYDKLYGFADEQGQSTSSSDRTVVIYRINEDRSYDVLNEENPIRGQACSIFTNPYDTLLYLYYKFDQHKFGGTPFRLYTIAPESGNFLIGSIDLPARSFYPDIDHSDNARFYFNNIIRPYIDPYDNEIYLPGGGHSHVVVADFDPCEPLFLSPGWSWLAFPRLEREQNNAVPLNEVLDGNILPRDFQVGELQNRPLGEVTTYSVFWSNQQNKWLPTSNFNSIKSNLGYKLNLESPIKERNLILLGSLLDPSWTTAIFPQHENWLGYYLPFRQSPPDAIPDEIEADLTYLLAQNWACYNDDPIGDNCVWRCVSNKGKIELKYGDGIIVGARSTGINFRWEYNGFPLSQEERPTAEFFDYTEQSEYTALFIEPDTSNLPLEIGAFVGDSCVGATSVFPEDTLLLIQAYDEGLSGELTFQCYYGGTKSSIPMIHDYYVRNNLSGRREKRTVHSREDQDYFVISFTPRESKDDILHQTQGWIQCSPNPIQTVCHINYYNPSDGLLTITLMDLFGRQVSTLMRGYHQAGHYTLPWRISETGSIASGVYYLSMEGKAYRCLTKVILIH